ncbi:hypothetical protein MTO96_037583, partial [Rhipicephalus appendiculatus]
CVASRLVDISPIGALAALIDLVGLVLGSLGVLGSALESVTNILTPLCAVVDVPGCISMLSGSDTCYRPIPVSLPGYLDIGGSAASSGGLLTRATLGTLTTLVSTTITCS